VTGQSLPAHTTFNMYKEIRTMNSLKHPNAQTTRIVKLGMAIGLVAAFAVGASPSMAQPTMSVDQMKQRIESNFGVKVLRVEGMLEQGRSAFAVTTMKSGGDFNDAYQVNTVVVDSKTGDLIRQYRHTPNGMRPAAPSVGLRTSPRMSTTR